MLLRPEGKEKENAEEVLVVAGNVDFRANSIQQNSLDSCPDLENPGPKTAALGRLDIACRKRPELSKLSTGGLHSRPSGNVR
jgi:hypothetical protein